MVKWIQWLCVIGLLLTGCDAFGAVAVVETAVPPPPTPQPDQRQTTPTATAPPTQPPPTNTPVPQPSPTFDPQLADWTILVYLDADNNLERAGLLDLQEMEAAAGSDRVNVVVQMDRALGETAVSDPWTTARRYLIQPDNDPTLVSSQLLADLGERNMGDPAELADFIQWGTTAYPANRTALIIWDHGAGWNGIAFDENSGADGSDHITLQDLKVGLATGLSSSPIDRLDVVGFDACLMGQLDVFHALQPYAAFAVGSEELTPGLGWDYTALLNNLTTNSGMDGAQLARQMVTDFINYYTEIEPDQFVTMSAIDLNQLPQVTNAVSQLAEQITTNASSVASAVGDARSGAESFARVYADDYERYAAIDLHHFADILAQRSPSAAVQDAAQRVMAAVETAVFAHQSGSGFQNSAGIALYFPRNSSFYDPAYAQATGLPAWDQFLNSYYAVGFTGLPNPELQINSVLQETAGAQNPTLLTFEIIGREIENVTVQAARVEENGRLRLVEYDNLIPEPTLLPDGSELVEWRDGVHQDFFVWDTQVTYLFDDTGNGDFVVMWPTEYGSSLFTVQGQFQRAATGEQFAANLVFDHALGEMTRVWSYDSDSKTAVSELFPQPGDRFILDALFLDDTGNIVREPSTTFTFNENGKLLFEKRPLPSGSYRFSFKAENVAGAATQDSIDLTVVNEELTPEVTAYLDPYLGFQFLYPTNWFRPVYDDALLYTSARESDQRFQMQLYPNLDEAFTLKLLQEEVLRQFGAVSILFEDEIIVGDRLGLRTAYGYSDASGERTGQFVVLIEENTGFAIDIDGSLELEEATIGAMQQILQSWQFAPDAFVSQPSRWSRVEFETFSVAQPADFVYSQFNEWQRFSSGQFSFVALRTQPVERATNEMLTQLVVDAGVGVEGFVAETAVPYGLNGRIWQRVDFSYQADSETEIWGYIMVREEANRHIVAWAEAPAAVYNQLETAVYLTMIADLEAKSR